MTLRVERRVEPSEEVVEGVPELLQLVLWPVERETLAQVRGGDLSGRTRDGPDRSKHSAGYEPAREESEDSHDRERRFPN